MPCNDWFSVGSEARVVYLDADSLKQLRVPKWQLDQLLNNCHLLGATTDVFVSDEILPVLHVLQCRPVIYQRSQNEATNYTTAQKLATESKRGATILSPSPNADRFSKFYSLEPRPKLCNIVDYVGRV